MKAVNFSCGCKNVVTKKGSQTYVCDGVKDEDMQPGDKRRKSEPILESHE
jgi:hypothetical protein